MKLEDLLRKLDVPDLGALLADLRGEGNRQSAHYATQTEDYLIGEILKEDPDGQKVMAWIANEYGVKEAPKPRATVVKGTKPKAKVVEEDEDADVIREFDPETGRVKNTRRLSRGKPDEGEAVDEELVDETGSSWKHPFGIGRRGRRI